MTYLTRIVLGTELQGVLRKVDEARRQHGNIDFKMYQLDGQDKYRLVFKVPFDSAGWDVFSMPAPPES